MSKHHPTVTIRDLHAVGTLLDEVERTGRGAFRRAAEVAKIRLSLVNDSLDRIEGFLGYRLLEVGASGRRRSVLTPIGSQFKFGVADVLSAWEKALGDVAIATVALSCEQS